MADPGDPNSEQIRHPSWCSPEHCKATRSNGQHRSRPSVVDGVALVFVMTPNADRPRIEVVDVSGRTVELELFAAVDIGHRVQELIAGSLRGAS